MANETETSVRINAGETVNATFRLSGDLRFCHISDLFLFETASSFIDSSIPDHKVAFREILDRIRHAAPGESLLVVGHTDQVGSPSDNDQLSQRRADSVLAVLQGNVTVWENIYQAERRNAWGDNNFRTMLQEVTSSTPSQTEINRHKEISVAGEQRRVTLFTQYFDALLGHPAISLLFDTLIPPTLACGERHILGPGNHPPSRRAEVFFFRGNVSPIITCDEYPNWQTPCQILPPITPTVTIASVSALRQGQVERIQVTVNPSPLPPAVSITMELSTTLGTGEAQFVSTNSRTMVITQSEAVRVRGITQSSTVDNIRMTAKVTGQANILAQEDFTVVSTSSNPAITLSFPIVVVDKSYTNPGRQSVRLGINPLTSTLVGSGTFTRSDDRIRFFNTAGTEITFDGRDNVFTDAELNAGVTLFAEGNRPSAALDDVQLSLTFRDTARRQIGTPVTATMTAVELTLDICESRTAPGIDPAPLSTNDKINVGRFVQTPNPGFDHERAMLIVRPPNPSVFNGVLELTAIDASTVRAFNVELPGALQLPILNPQIIQSASIPPNGTSFFVEGLAASTLVRDTGYRLGIQGLAAEADRVTMTAVQFDLTTTSSAIVPATPFVRFGLWDHAFDPATGNLRNGAADADHFIGADSRHFFFRLRDINAAGTPQIEWSTLKADGTNDHAPVAQPLPLVETVPGSHRYFSRPVFMVTDDVDRQLTNSGLAAADLALLFPRIRKVTVDAAHQLDGRLAATYIPSAGQIMRTATVLFSRNPEERRRLRVHLVNVRTTVGGAGVLSGARRTTAIDLFHSIYAVCGIFVDVDEILIDPPASCLAWPTIYPHPVNAAFLAGPVVEGFTFTAGHLVASTSQSDIITAVRALASFNADDIYIVFTNRILRTPLPPPPVVVPPAPPPLVAFTAGGGQAFPDSWTTAGSAARGFAFVSVLNTNNLAEIHEATHITTNLNNDAGGHFDLGAPDPAPGPGNIDGRNLMHRHGLIRNGDIRDSKRLWNSRFANANYPTTLVLDPQIDSIRRVGARFIKNF